MTNIARLNLTYHIPVIDFKNQAGYNPDGKINIPFTLAKMRIHLQKNLDTVNKLLENIAHVKDIGVSEYDNLYIEMDSQEITEKLIRDKVLAKNMDESDDDYSITSENNDIPPELLLEEEPETNANRLAMINNLVNQDNAEMIYGKNNQDDDDIDVLGSDKEPLFDDINLQNVIGKYEKIMVASKNYYSDDSREYDSSESE